MRTSSLAIRILRRAAKARRAVRRGLASRADGKACATGAQVLIAGAHNDPNISVAQSPSAPRMGNVILLNLAILPLYEYAKP